MYVGAQVHRLGSAGVVAPTHEWSSERLARHSPASPSPWETARAGKVQRGIRLLPLPAVSAQRHSTVSLDRRRIQREDGSGCSDTQPWPAPRDKQPLRLTILALARIPSPA